jgi:CAAX prenyl protease-like protein
MKTDNSAMAGYIAPLVVFGVFTEIEGWLAPAWYPYVYTAKLCAVMLSLWIFRFTLRDLRPRAAVVAPSVVIGLVVFVLWVGIDKYVPYPHFGSRTAFNPLEAFPTAFGRTVFLLIRFWGLVIVVPVMEELFWRSFLIRYITSPDFRRIPIGEFSTTAFWAVAGLSGLAHPEWLVAVITNVIYSWLLKNTRSLFATFVAHATTNAALGAYVLITHDWKYW